MMNTNDLTLDDFEKEMPRAVTIAQVIAALLNEDRIFPPAYLPRFSDLSPDDIQALTNVWPQVTLNRRQNLMEDLQTLAASDYMLSFEEIARLAVQDEDPLVRFGGVQTLIANECSNPALIHLFLGLLEGDADENVRAASASALGAFVYAGEIGKISPALLESLEARLLQAFSVQHSALVRRCVLESLGFSSRPEVPALIRQAAESGEEAWQTSALFAMGRSADEIWCSYVLAMLESPRASLRAEAARAAGELELKEARTLLRTLADDDDEDVRAAALWSLSQIGGRGVREVLQRHLDASDDETEIAFLEDALDNLAFTDGEDTFDLLNISPEDDFSDEDFFDDESNED
ncbi:MAG: hypothetical protein Fur0018_06770 [Anaerolineales bacterium]